MLVIEQNSKAMKFLINIFQKVIKRELASKDTIQCYVAYFKQNPSGAYQSISKFLPGGAEYDKIFTEELMDDYRTILVSNPNDGICQK